MNQEEPTTEPFDRRNKSLGDTTTLGSFDVPAREPSDASHILTVVAGRETGRPILLAGSQVTLGREPSCDVILQGRGVSRLHAELQSRGDGQWFLSDRASRNGTFVNGERIERTVLAPGDEIRIGYDTVIKYSLADSSEASVRIANYHESISDPLTTLCNRRHFMNQLEYQVEAANRRKSPFSVVLFDLDHFKKVNDSFGHAVGDIVLRRVADCVLNSIRPEDVIGRYGGEEFALLIDGSSPDEAYVAVERIRFRVARLRFRVEGQYVTVTASFGIADFDPQAPIGAEELVAQADRNLYRAKESGRNQTVGSTRSRPNLKTVTG